MTAEQGRFQDEQMAQMVEGVRAGEEAAQARRKELEEEERRLRDNPELLLEEVNKSIHRLAEVFEATQQDPQAPQTLRESLVSPEEELYFAIDRFESLREIARDTKVRLRVPGFGQARKLVAATLEIERGLNSVSNTVIIFSENRQIPAGRALQAALRNSQTPLPGSVQ